MPALAISLAQAYELQHASMRSFLELDSSLIMERQADAQCHEIPHGKVTNHSEVQEHDKGSEFDYESITLSNKMARHHPFVICDSRKICHSLFPPVFTECGAA